MDFTCLLEFEGLDINEMEKKEASYEVHCTLNNKEARCPSCQKNSTTIRSYYSRKIQDLPMNGKEVYLIIRCRKFQCKNNQCDKKVFAQEVNFTHSHSTKTIRLENFVLETAIHTSLIE
ncbi:transposase family protein [Enterococcus sp. LJL98]